jgi:DNA-binding NarL/FixJ family response regulator
MSREHDALTRREHEIVSLMTAGLSNKEIARQLRIQNATVKNHIHSILGKLQVRRRGQVAARMRAAPAHAAQPSVADRRALSTQDALAQFD